MSSLHPSTAGAPLTDCAQVVAGQILPGTSAEDVLVHGVTLDSRAVRPGDLYAALPGANTHGARFAAGAAAAGAVAVLTDPAGRDLIATGSLEVPLVIVPRPRDVLGALAAHVYGTGTLPLRMIGLTGTNGKTTTAYLLASALTALAREVGLIGTVEIRIGTERVTSARTTPESCDLHRLLAVMAERGAQDCVMEVSSHALALHRVDGVRYDVALFTNLSQDHLDFHADMEDYFAAKASLFTPERAERGIVCVDDEWGARLAREAGVPVVTIGSHGPAGGGTAGGGAPGPDFTVTRGDGTGEFTLTGPDGVLLRLRSALPGDFNIMNTAMAAATLLTLGHPAGAVERAVLTDPHVPGRMERVSVDAPHAPLGIVDYAHTPDAVAAAVAALRGSAVEQLIVVLGAGGGRDVGKRPGMGRAAAGADVVIVTDDNPRGEDPAQIRAAVLAGAHDAATGALVEEVAGRRDAIDRAVQIACATGKSAVIAVVGKGHETGQEIDGVIHPFDDRRELAAALERHAGVTR